MRINFKHPILQNLKLKDLKAINNKCRQAREIKEILGTNSCKELFSKNKPILGSFEDLGIKRLEE